MFMIIRILAAALSNLDWVKKKKKDECYEATDKIDIHCLRVSS